jgi:hypothetical protein
MTLGGGWTKSQAKQGILTLNAAKSGYTENATVLGSQLYIRRQIDNESILLAKESAVSFGNVLDFQVKEAFDLGGKLRELDLLYGQDGLGKVTGISGSGTTRVLTISAATYAPQIWAGTEGWDLNLYDGATCIGNTTPTSTDATFTISAVDVEARTITVTGSSAGCSALATAIGSGVTADIYLYNCYGKEMAGFKKIMTNTGSLFGINATTYSLWKSNTYDANGGMTFDKLGNSIIKAVNKGGLDGEVVAVLNPEAWQDVMSDIAGTQKNTNYNQTYSKDSAEYGFEVIKYHTTNGLCTLLPHPYVKLGDGFVFPKENIKRIGATDLTWNDDAINEGKYFIRLAEQTGYEFRLTAHQAIFIEKPAQCTYIHGITS